MVTSFVQVVAGVAAGLGMLLSPVLPVAQSDYPNKPVRLIIGFPRGGSTDIVGRIVALKFSERFAQQVIVDNRGGAGRTFGTIPLRKKANDS